MNKSDSIANLAVALSQAQKEMPVVLFDAKNPFLKNNYATLGAIISATKPVLAAHGLSISQFPVSEQGRIGVTSILMHESGEFLEETISLVPEHGRGVSDNQAAGITITYLRRYAWASICGAYADEDADGANAQANEVVGKAMADKTTGEVALIRNWSLEQLETAHTALGMTAEDDYESVTPILNLSVLPDDAPVKTIKSWVGHFKKGASGDNVARAQVANEAYIEAKKSKTGGK